MNRDELKQAIKKIILQEITNNQFGTPDHADDVEGAKAVENLIGKDGKTISSPGTGKVVGDKKKHNVAFSRQSDDNYDVVSITNGSDRKTAKGLTLDNAVKFAKDHADASETSYVEKARAKSINSGKEIKPETPGTKVEDTMEESDEDTQKDIADDNDKKAEEKVDKDLAPINSDIASQMGGALVDKIEKIIDRVLKGKDKVEPKTAYLKTNSKMESPDKLTVKDKGTPALKEKKK